MAAVDAPIPVAILTTRSVVSITRIAAETEARFSVMCIRRTAAQTGISRRYHEFVSRDTGLIAKMTGERTFRLDVDSDIDEGRSFELPVFLAHRLHQQHRLLMPGMPTGPGPTPLWIATGTVDVDRQVGPIDGLTQKLATLESWLASTPSAGRIVRLLLPEGNRLEAAARLDALAALGVRTEFVTQADDPFSLPVQPAPRASSSASTAGRSLTTAAMVLALMALASAGTVLVLHRAQPEESDRGTTTATPLLDATAAAGPLAVVVRDVDSEGTCFGSARRVREHPARAGETVVLPAEVTRCRLEIVATSGSARRAWLVGRNGAAIAPIDLGPRGSLLPLYEPEDQGLEVAFHPSESPTAEALAQAPRITVQFDRP